MTELVDVPDLKSGARNGVPVQFRLPAPAFASEASEGCRAEAQRAKAGWLPLATARRAEALLYKERPNNDREQS